MKHLHEIIFPSLRGKWGQVDLNEIVKSVQGAEPTGENPLLDPAIQAAFLNQLHADNGWNYSHGGYLEDRSILWRGHYHDPTKMIHLGIDFNVPEGTEVYLPYLGRPVLRIFDSDQNGGWGGRLDFYSERFFSGAEGYYFILGHLDPDSMIDLTGSYLGKGTISVAKVGKSTVNGGWAPHLHLQIVSKVEYESYADPMQIDGYGGGDDLRSRFPDPEGFMDLRA
jgi:hypothetical protein